MLNFSRSRIVYYSDLFFYPFLSLLTVLAKCLVQYSIIFYELSEIVDLQAYPKKTNGNACWAGKKSALRLAIHFG